MSNEKKQYRIAVIPGDGIGKEVVPEGLRVLEAAAKKHGVGVHFVIVVRREVEMVELHSHAVLFRGRLDDAQALRHHLLADAVAGNNRDPVWFF